MIRNCFALGLALTLVFNVPAANAGFFDWFGKGKKVYVGEDLITPAMATAFKNQCKASDQSESMIKDEDISRANQAINEWRGQAQANEEKAKRDEAKLSAKILERGKLSASDLEDASTIREIRECGQLAEQIKSYASELDTHSQTANKCNTDGCTAEEAKKVQDTFDVAATNLSDRMTEAQSKCHDKKSKLQWALLIGGVALSAASLVGGGFAAGALNSALDEGKDLTKLKKGNLDNQHKIKLGTRAINKIVGAVGVAMLVLDVILEFYKWNHRHDKTQFKDKIMACATNSLIAQIQSSEKDPAVKKEQIRSLVGNLAGNNADQGSAGFCAVTSCIWQLGSDAPRDWKKSFINSIGGAPPPLTEKQKKDHVRDEAKRFEDGVNKISDWRNKCNNANKSYTCETNTVVSNTQSTEQPVR